MGRKYLGNHFDIHGGGMDLVFPHHECEIAQAVASQGDDMVKYWMHNNMITINGQKMGKSLNNFITLSQFFSGDHEKLERAYSPMTIRFFILQAHYRSTVDFSNEALQAAEKGLQRLTEGYNRLMKIVPANETTVDVNGLRQKCEEAMQDDLNSPIVIAHLFDALKAINTINDGKATINAADLDELKSVFKLFFVDILGLKMEDAGAETSGLTAMKGAVDLLLQIRQEAKANKDWATADKIRNELSALGFEIKDGKDKVEWTLK
jgi:cysteinyl-tRNA synthetase